MRRLLVIIAACATLAPALLRGQAPDPLAELRSRLDALEQENRALRAVVLERLPAATPRDEQASYFAGSIQPTPALNESRLDENRVRSIIEEYLAQRGVQPANFENAALQPSAPAAPKVEVIGSDLNMTGKWTSNGAELQTKDGAFKAKIAGRVQFDNAFIGTPDPNRITSIPAGAGTKDSTFFRRLRVGGYGTMWEQIDWAADLDFVDSEFNVDPAAGGNNPPTGLRSGPGFPASGNVMSYAAPADVWMTFRELPFGSMRVGSQKEMIGLDHADSSRFLDFLERSVLQDAFNGPNNNGFSPGISATNTTRDQRATWALGVFKNNNYSSGFPFDFGNQAYCYDGRITWTPYYDDASDGRYLVHLGLGSSFRTFDNEPDPYTGGTNVRIRVRGDIRNVASTLTPNYADTGNFYTTNQTLLNPEFALVYGPLFIQAEYEQCFMGGASAIKNGPSLGNVHFQAGAVQVLYFLTGEHRAYNRQTASFGRVVPLSNAIFARDAGLASLGAWQLGFRYDWVDLNSGLIKGGNVHNLTAGINWFLNPSTKVQFNYVAGFVDALPPMPGPNNSLNGAHFVGKGVINSASVRLAWDY